MPSLIMSGRRWQASVIALTLVAAVSGCESFLEADNPGAIPADDLDNPTYVTLMERGAIGEFQLMYPRVNYYIGLFTDELRNHHVFVEEREIDRRAPRPEHGTFNVFFYTPLHRARFMADSSASRMRVLLGDSATVDNRLARVLAYAGYTHVILAENLCNSPVDGSAPYEPDELLSEFAIPKFAEALEIADRIAGDATRSAAVRATADSIRSFARVGIARAYLNLNDKTNAAQYANAFLTAVTDTLWTFRAWYSENSIDEYMYLRDRLTGGSAQVSGSVNSTPYETMRDRRVPRPAATENTQNGLAAFVPNSSRAYSTYTGDNTAMTDSARRVGGDFARAGWVRIASWREARYIIAEAEGNTPANLAFLNAQKKLSEDTATVIPTTDAEYHALLREQRQREFYLDGHRLGDLRRYKRFHQVDEYQRGPYLGSATEIYEPLECWPLPLAELNGNPNVPRP